MWEIKGGEQKQTQKKKETRVFELRNHGLWPQNFEIIDDYGI